jgi:elongation factor 1-beta
MSFGDLKTESGVAALNKFLADASYIQGFKPTTSDTAIFTQLASSPDSFSHALRWYKHIASFSAEEKASFAAGTCVQAAPVQKKAAASDDEDDSDDPFGASGSEDEDDDDETPEQKAHREKMQAQAKAKADEKAKKAKKVVVGKSEITLDVKPWDDETDMKKLEECVRSIEIEGLIWGMGKLIPVGYGINKLRIMSVVVDDLVSTDDMQEKIEAFEDYVQSTDIHAFNKI